MSTSCRRRHRSARRGTSPLDPTRWPWTTPQPMPATPLGTARRSQHEPRTARAAGQSAGQRSHRRASRQAAAQAFHPSRVCGNASSAFGSARLPQSATSYVNYTLCPAGKQAWFLSLAAGLGKPLLGRPDLGNGLPLWARWVGGEAVWQLSALGELQLRRRPGGPWAGRFARGGKQFKRHFRASEVARTPLRQDR